MSVLCVRLSLPALMTSSSNHLPKNTTISLFFMAHYALLCMPPTFALFSHLLMDTLLDSIKGNCATLNTDEQVPL